MVQHELKKASSGVRKLKDTDFLGPKEHAKRRLVKAQDGTAVAPNQMKKDHTRYFIALEQRQFDNKRRIITHATKKQGEVREATNAAEAMESDGDALREI